ncbi:MAG TPA: rod shape-determining protein MreC [Terracidiphilus sp.]|nr:rod shape-determining protein MreC [Terracidiphilus sp.]
MESAFSRYRNLIVLFALLVAQILGLAMQVRRTGEGISTANPKDASGVRLIRLWAQLLVAPPERAIHSTKITAVELWQNYIDLRQVRRQNQNLQDTIDRLRLEQASLLEDARQGQRLQALLDFQHRYIYSTLAAQAIGSSGTDQSRVFYLDKGSNYGLKPDMAVITADGIVGKVREVFPRTAQVLAINDQTSGAGVILATTRIRGILTGNADGQLEIVGILADERIKPGEKVLTAGGDLVFPRGLPVGEVEKVVRDPDRDAFIDVILKPAAHLGSLDEVLVITSTEPHLSPVQQQDLATSEAVKGDEAEAIKDQLKASEIMAERLPGLINPNLPPDQQPLLDTSKPNPAAPPPQPLHPDRFTPGANPQTSPDGEDAPNSAAPVEPQSAKPQTAKPQTAKPERNP